MRFVVYESQTPRFALYGPTKNKEIVKCVRGFSYIKIVRSIGQHRYRIADRQWQKICNRGTVKQKHSYAKAQR